MIDLFRFCFCFRRPFAPFWTFAAGALSVLAFAPFGYFPLAFLGPLLLFARWNSDGSAPFREGWAFGLGLFGFGVFWMHISIDQFGGVGTALAVVITLGFIAFMALYLGLLGVAAVWLGRGMGPAARLLLLYPALWTLTEWLRGWVLTGFPWLALGYSQIDAPLAGIAPWLGVYGISWAVALSAGLVLFAFQSEAGQRQEHREHGGAQRTQRGISDGNGVYTGEGPNEAQKRKPNPFLRVLRASPCSLCSVFSVSALGGLIVLWGAAWGMGQLSWVEPVGKPLRVALVQGNIEQERKWQPDQIEEIAEAYLNETRRVWLESDLIVWPETAIPTFAHNMEDTLLAPMERAAKEQGATLLLGIPLWEEERQEYYNGMMALGTAPREVYAKRHLVPFGEFLPMKRWLRPLLHWLRIPMSDFSPGARDQPPPLAAGHALGISICYEDAFGEEVVDALPKAALLVNASNDGWFGDSLAPHQHLEIARMRSRETQRWLLRATNTGISALVDPAGRVVRQIPQFQRAVLQGEAQPLQGATPYTRFGNRPVASLALLLGGAALWRRRRRMGDVLR